MRAKGGLVTRLPAIAIILLAVSFLAYGVLRSLHTSKPARAVARLSVAPPPASRAEAALRQAEHYRTRAKLAVEQERTALESWDRDGTEGMDWEAWRLQRLAADPTGDMRKARVLALEAVAAARTQQEKCQAMELQLLLEREAGHQEEALQLARRLLALAPTSDRARQVFRSALQYRARATLDQGPAVKRTRTWKAP